MTIKPGAIVFDRLKPGLPLKVLFVGDSYATCVPAREAMVKEPKSIPLEALAPWPADLEDLA